MKQIILAGLFMMQFPLMAQDINLRVEVSTDSILYGNYLEVRFTIENAGGDFSAPAFDGFEILSGPNTSSSFSMINGNVTQKASYSYMIRPTREGMIYIDPASFQTDDKVLETDPIGIMVYPNPGGIEENKPFMEGGDGFNSYFRGKESNKQNKKRSFEKNKRRI